MREITLTLPAPSSLTLTMLMLIVIEGLLTLCSTTISEPFRTLIWLWNEILLVDGLYVKGMMRIVDSVENPKGDNYP